MTTLERKDKSQQLSEAITWLRFPLIFMIILLHCYSTVSLPGNHTTYFKAIYPFALLLGESGVPGFFFISGFLFFYSKKNYTQKITTRIRTLLIPYFLWNSFLIFIYLIAFFAGYPQDINGRSMTEYTFLDYLRLFWDRGTYDDGNFVPILCPFWYIRNLLIMSVLSPLLFYLIKYLREFFLLYITFWWLTTPHNAFIPQTILFFSLGAYFSIFRIDPLGLFINKKIILLQIAILLAAGDIITHIAYPTPYNLQIHRLSLIANIPALFIIANCFCRHGIVSVLLPNAAFFIFCIHYPLVIIMRRICAAKLGNSSDMTHILLYIICVLATTILSIAIYYCLNRYFPRLIKVLSGNR